MTTLTPITRAQHEVTEHTDDYMHPRSEWLAEIQSAVDVAEHRLAKLSAIQSEAETTYRQCQDATIADAKQGNNSLGQHVIASGVAHKFMRMSQ